MTAMTNKKCVLIIAYHGNVLCVQMAHICVFVYTITSFNQCDEDFVGRRRSNMEAERHHGRLPAHKYRALQRETLEDGPDTWEDTFGRNRVCEMRCTFCCECGPQEYSQ